MLGWCKWEDKRPTDYHVGFVRDRYKPPKRSELGDDDSSRWERRGGDRVDPPRVALQADHYTHQEYGRVEKPRFAIVGWEEPPAVKPVRPPASLSQAIDYGAAPQIEHKPQRGKLDDIEDLPF
jgi:hypothetical protein